MIAYKYKLYNTHKNKHLDKMFEECCYIWNHTIELQRRYYKFYGKYLNRFTLSKHYTKRYKRNFIGCDTMQEILRQIDISYNRFFKGISKRPPKKKRPSDYSSFIIKGKPNGVVRGVIFNNNQFYIKYIKKNFKFFKSREYKGKIRSFIINRNKAGDYYIVFITEHNSDSFTKSRNGACVGIDFGLKTYLTLSNGQKIKNPEFLKTSIKSIKQGCAKVGRSKRESNNRLRNIKALNRINRRIINKRTDFQWKLAHFLCEKYDFIFIEDLNIESLCQKERYGRKMRDLAHSSFINKLSHIANKYGTIVHKIKRYYPSSKICGCGYIYKELGIKERTWKCPQCGTIHDRDILAANNILRQGIVELGVKQNVDL